MAEPTWTVMTIGGKAPTKVIEEDLATAASEDFPSGDGMSSVKELIANAVEDGTSVVFQGQCSFGEVGTLSSFCRENGLSYHVSWSAVSSVFDAGLEYWHPGMVEPVAEGASDDGDPMAGLPWLQAELRAGKTLEQVVADLAKGDSSAIPPLETDDLISRMEAAA